MAIDDSILVAQAVGILAHLNKFNSTPIQRELQWNRTLWVVDNLSIKDSFISHSNNTFLDLQEEDNLFIVDGTNVSFIQRFRCTYLTSDERVCEHIETTILSSIERNSSEE